MKCNLRRLGETDKPRRGKRHDPTNGIAIQIRKETEERMIARNWLVLYAQFNKGMRLGELVDRYMPRAGSWK